MIKVINSKFSAMLLAVIIVFTGLLIGSSTLVCKVHATSVTQAKAVAWANERYYEGWCVDYDGVYGCQCVDLIKYYCDYLGDAHGSFTRGNACAYATNPLPSGWIRDSSPKAGDIFVCQPGANGAGSYGHVGIVTEVRGSKIVLVNTNAGGANGKCTVHEENASGRTYIRPNFYTAPANTRPIGYLDSVDVGLNCIKVRGWEFDPDHPSVQTDVHIYIGDECHSVKTDKERTDVDNVHHCGAWHGFEATIYTKKTGAQTVRAYGIDATDGNYNTELSSSPKTVNIPSDTEAPSITNVNVTDKDSTGYTISCTVTDNQSGIDVVKFPTWTADNGQDDLQDWTGTSVTNGVKNGNKWSFRVNTWDHNAEIGTYCTHIYAYDKAGNSKAVGENNIEVTNKTAYGTDFYAKIINTKCSKSVVVASEGNNVQLDDSSNVNSDRKIWHFIKKDNGTYAILNAASGLAMDVNSWSKANCANFAVYEHHGGTNQSFYLVPVGKSVKILASHCGKAMDLTNFDTRDGANIALYDDNGTDAQKFTLQSISKTDAAEDDNSNPQAIGFDRKLVKSGDTVYCAIGKYIVKVNLKKKSHKKIIKTGGVSVGSTNALSIYDGYAYYVTPIGSAWDKGYLCRASLKTHKTKKLFSWNIQTDNSSGAIDSYMIDNNKIFVRCDDYSDYTYYSMNLNGSDITKISKIKNYSVTETQCNEKGYKLKYKKYKYCKPKVYLNKPSGKIYLGIYEIF